MGKLLAKLFAACGLVAAIWVLSALVPQTGEGWVHVVNKSRPGNSPVRILHFYTTSGAIKAGEKALLCYGVENAKSVEIAPMMEGVLPSANRCLEVGPLHTTHYTILAEGFDGHIVTQSLTLPVNVEPRRAPPSVPVWLAVTRDPVLRRGARGQFRL